MDKTKIAKVATLIMSVFISLLVFLDRPDWTAVGIYSGCSMTCRVLYTFYHANLLHALLNAWCLLSVVFIYDTSVWRLLIAYIIACTIPAVCLSDVPTVGLSGVVFALFGSISFEVERKMYYQLWILAYIVIGFLFPNTNAWVHLYCYGAGVAMALLNKPIKIG